LASPTPAHECTVMPLTWRAAMPVVAVTWYGRCRCSSRRVISCRRNDLPTPAEPVKKTLPPVRTCSSTASCSSEQRSSGVQICGASAAAAAAAAPAPYSSLGLTSRPPLPVP